MLDLSDDQLSEVYSFAVQLGKDAGDMLMAAARKRFENQGGPSTKVSYVEKDNAVDIVTSTDNGKWVRQDLSWAV
jgi:myo-inositol-1(or 4)-monophosphatase